MEEELVIVLLIQSSALPVIPLQLTFEAKSINI